MMRGNRKRPTRRVPRQVRRAGAATVALAAAAVLAGCGTEGGAGGTANDGGGGDAGAGAGSGSGDGDGANSGDSGVDVEAIRWIPERVTISGEEHARPAEDTQSYLEIEDGHDEDPGGASGGMIGCNHWGTDVTIEGDTMKVGESVTTAMGCPEDSAGFAGHFLEVFEGRLTYEVNAGDTPDAPATLTLTNAAGATIELTEDPKGPGNPR